MVFFLVCCEVTIIAHKLAPQSHCALRFFALNVSLLAWMKRKQRHDSVAALASYGSIYDKCGTGHACPVPCRLLRSLSLFFFASNAFGLAAPRWAHIAAGHCRRSAIPTLGSFRPIVDTRCVALSIFPSTIRLPWPATSALAR